MKTIIILILVLLAVVYYNDPSSLHPWIEVVSNMSKVLTHTVKDIGITLADVSGDL